MPEPDGIRSCREVEKRFVYSMLQIVFEQAVKASSHLIQTLRDVIQLHGSQECTQASIVGKWLRHGGHQGRPPPKLEYEACEERVS